MIAYLAVFAFVGIAFVVGLIVVRLLPPMPENVPGPHDAKRDPGEK
jgi:hypothetical protein